MKIVSNNNNNNNNDNSNSSNNNNNNNNSDSNNNNNNNSNFNYLKYLNTPKQEDECVIEEVQPLTDQLPDVELNYHQPKT